jgi:hypothetical protein
MSIFISSATAAAADVLTSDNFLLAAGQYLIA